MTGNNILYIILIAVLAFGIAYLQYFFKAKRKSKKIFLFAFLRFLSLFLLGLLFLNPKFKQTQIENLKPKLVVAIDDSQSVKFLNQDNQVNQFVAQIKKSDLSNQFDIEWFHFDRETQLGDSVSFNGKQTNLSKLFSELKNIDSKNVSPTIVITDGNQTYGQDYVLNSTTYKQPIYPVVIGDTIVKSDVKIQHIQHNKYVYLENDFPVEATLSCQGKKPVNQEFEVYKGNTKVFSRSIGLSATKNTEVINFTLPATTIGKSVYKAIINPLAEETNIKNNERTFSVTVIDERTKLAIVSDIIHPDLGALKKAIETNKQRQVDFIKPNDISNLNDYQLVILYQPNTTFKEVFTKISQLEKNYWLITGLQTNWNFLNSNQDKFQFVSSNQSQDYLAAFNNGFNLFQTEDILFSSFPPLQEKYGDLKLSSNHKVLLYQQIASQLTEVPLLSFFEEGNNRSALLTGEGLWKWRAQSFINEQSFEDFDAFIGKTIQFLASNSKKERLVISTQETYNLGEAKVEAQYFDKNYILDSNKQLRIKLIEKSTAKEYQFDLLYKGNTYLINLESLAVGNYNFTVSVVGESISKKGAFEILDFNIEEQFLNPDVTKLQQIATNKEKSIYLLSDFDKLVNNLKNNEQFKTIQKSTQTNSPLIDWEYLLAAILLLLGLEWFLRKYNGLI